MGTSGGPQGGSRNGYLALLCSYTLTLIGLKALESMSTPSPGSGTLETPLVETPILSVPGLPDHPEV